MEPQTSRIPGLQCLGAYIPDKAYLFFPSRQQQMVQVHDNVIRYFFFGQIEFQQSQQKMLQQFHQYLNKNNLSIPFPKFYQDQRLLLFLYGNKFKLKQTYQAIIKNRNWRLQNLPPTLNPKRKQVLQNGYIYVCGRDKSFRPIIVLKQKNLEKELLDQYLSASIYGFQFIINNMFLPGQIQNWIFIYDLEGFSLSDISIDTFKKVNNVMSSNYGGKLYRNYVVNAHWFIWGVWKMFKGVVDPVTVQKISIDTGVSTLSQLFKECDKSQVETKYGGTQPNIVNYWPPNLPQPVVSQQHLVSKKQYCDLYMNQKLLKNIISPQIDSMLCS